MSFSTIFGVAGLAGDHCAHRDSIEHGGLDVVDRASRTVDPTSGREPDRAFIVEAVDDAGYSFVG